MLFSLFTFSDEDYIVSEPSMVILEDIVVVVVSL